jgi:Tfp pilus assembly PilM family ATPase
VNALERLRASLPAEPPRALAGLAARLRPRASGRVGPIGLELGREALHLVQLETGSAGLRIRAASALPLPDSRAAVLAAPAGLRGMVRAALRSRPFRGRRAVAALAAPDVKLMVFDYACADEAAEPQAVLRLVVERVNEPPDELVIDYLPFRALGAGPGQRSALVAVARREIVIERLERLRLAGLEVEALEIAPAAIRRLAGALGAAGRDENALVLYAGRARGHLIVLWGRRLVLYREIDFGEDGAVEGLAKALDLEVDEAGALLRRHGLQPPGPGDPATDDPAASWEIAETAMEILKPSFYQLAEHMEQARVYTASKARGSAPDCAYLLGAFARWPRADRLLASLAPIPVRSLDPRDSLPVDDRAAAPADLEASSEVALAVGLALRGMQGDG